MFVVNVAYRAGRGLYDKPIPRPEESYRIFVSLSVIRCNSNSLHLQRVDIRG
jgi:hypothetical protein